MITTNLYNIIESELQKKGYNEYFNEGKITAFDKNFSLYHKMLKFDTDVSGIVTDVFFNGFTFSDAVDPVFKKVFTQRFLNREINRQTVEAFTGKVLYTTYAYQEYIETVFTDLLAYANNESTTTTTGTNDQEVIQNNVSHQSNVNVTDGVNVSDARQLESDLPQDNVNLNVADTVLNYGNRNSISRNQNTTDQTNTLTGDSTQNNTNTVTGSNNGNTVSKVKNLEMLIQSSGVLDELFNIYDKACFLQTW